MFQQLYLCEKPSQARDIAKQLHCFQKNEGYLSNDNIAVTWCFGHLLEAASPEQYCENIKPWRLEILPIIPNNWKMIIKPDCKKQFDIIKRLLHETELVIISCDADREGEVIAREILTLCNYKGNIQRLWLSALDDTSIQKALRDLRAGNTTEKLYFAGLGRQRADWLIGMNLTMAASSVFGSYGSGVISVGRVQTPTLRLVVDRDEAIENFKSQNYYELLAQFITVQKERFWAKWQPTENAVDEQGHCLNEAVINAIVTKIKNKTGKIDQFRDEAKTQQPPLCLSLSQLQKLASSRFGYSAKETLDIAQSLYETHKATTYPRTDCGYLPESQFNEAPQILTLLKTLDIDLTAWVERCDITQKSTVWNDKKITAHHAIIPTHNKQVDLIKLSEKEAKIYELIRSYYLAQFLGEYHYRLRSTTVVIEDELFKANCHTPVLAGWKALLQSLDDNEDDAAIETSNTIPTLSDGQTITEDNEEILAKKTLPPPRFSEGTLIDSMKSIGKSVSNEKYKKILKDNAGIGTEATRASIIETLFKRNYLTKKGKQVISTDKGRSLIHTLPPLVTDPQLTAQWEQHLESVENGEITLDEFLSLQTEGLTELLSIIKTLASTQEKQPEFQCPHCHKPLRKIFSQKNNAHFWGCSGYPLCRTTFPDVNSKPCFDPVQRNAIKKSNTTNTKDKVSFQKTKSYRQGK